MSCSITIRQRKAGRVDVESQLVKSDELNECDSQVKREPMPTDEKPEYSPGLAGVIAGETAICWVDPNAGLMYRGYDIHDMAQKASFEEVAYLLLNGELPNGKQWICCAPAYRC